MKHIKALILLAFLFTFADVNAQLSTNEQPVSFDTKLSLKVTSVSAVPIVTTPQLDMAKIEQEDKEDEEYDMPPRFGYSHKVNYDLNNSGIWYELPNGDKLWQLNVVCPNALSVNFCYDKFWIPEGGKFFIYSKDKRHSIGAFTSRNNKGDRENIRDFATELIYDSEVVLEYYQPKEVTTDAIISVESIVHGYRYIYWGQRFYGDTGNCMVNINCLEGQNWQNEKKAIAMIVVGGNRICTGALINTTELSPKPYFLTANHCLNGQDAVTSPYLNYNFYWNYETPGCVNTNTYPSFISTHGATILANFSYADFALLRLSDDPQSISNYTPYYLGWDHSGQSTNTCVCIHHPLGDVKKISTSTTQPVSTLYCDYTESSNGTHWKVIWAETQNGHSTTEGCSSGSPLLTAEHKVIGQLHGGYSGACENEDEPDWFGKLSSAWNGYYNNNDSIHRKLSCWLDSLNTGEIAIEGLLVIHSVQTMTTDQDFYGNIRITTSGQLTIQSDIEFKGNSHVIVEAGGELIINGGTLSNVDIVLKSGASLQITNGGIIETRNGFEAPIGTNVEIISGQIL